MGTTCDPADTWPHAGDTFHEAMCTAGRGVGGYGAGGAGGDGWGRPPPDGEPPGQLGPADRMPARPSANLDDAEGLGPRPQVPPSYGTMPLAASALAGV